MITTFVNCKVFQASTTRQEEEQFAACLQIKDGKVVFVGNQTDTLASINPRDKVIDLGGLTIVPGFIDGHIHLQLLGQALQKLDLTPCTSLSDIRATIKQYAKENPQKERILCRAWMHSMTAAEGQVHRGLLDDIDPQGRPIYIDSKDLHSCWCNSAAISELNIFSLPDPEGGKIHRRNDGSPTGLVEEAACVSLIWPFLARQAKKIERLGGLLSAVRSLSSFGYTGAIDMAMDEEGWSDLLELRRQFNDPIPLRIAAHWFIHPKNTDEENFRQVERALQLSKEYTAVTSPDLRIVGIKLMCDGVVDACTAHLVDPYSHNNKHPAPLWDPEALEKVVRKADENGLQCALHAIGDGAVKLALDTLEKAATPGRRHRIEHLELTRPGDATRLAELGITASIQPVHADPAILQAWDKLIGPARCKMAFAYRDFLQAGANVAIGTDAPTAPHYATGNLYVAASRKSARKPEDMLLAVNEHQKLTLCQAISSATTGSAFSYFAENRIGKLEPGLMADFAIINMIWTEEGLLKAKVKETWFEGRKVFHDL